MKGSAAIRILSVLRRYRSAKLKNAIAAEIRIDLGRDCTDEAAHVLLWTMGSGWALLL